MAEQGIPPRRFEWVTRHVPTRENIHQNRLLRPFAPHLTHNSLWRFNRRSVPRGVALGLFVGIIIPVMHTVIAAILAIPTRANVVVAAITTLAINPLTIPLMYYAAYRIGSWELHQDIALVDPKAAQQVSSELGRVLFWVHHASGPIALGILTLATGCATIGYFGAKFIWNSTSRSRFRRRRLQRQVKG